MCMNKLDCRTKALDSKSFAKKNVFPVSCTVWYTQHTSDYVFSEYHSANINKLLMLQTSLCFINVIRSVSAECLCIGTVSVSTSLSLQLYHLNQNMD